MCRGEMERRDDEKRYGEEVEEMRRKGRVAEERDA